MFLNFRFFYTGFYCVILNRRTVTWNLFVKLIDIMSEQIFNIIQVSWTSWFRKHDPNALLGVYYFIWLIWGCSTRQGIVFCPPLSKTASRVLPRIYHVGEKSWVAEGDEHPKGIRGLPPPPNENFFKWICAEMQPGTFRDTILRNVTVCSPTSSCLDDFSDIVAHIL